MAKNQLGNESVLDQEALWVMFHYHPMFHNKEHNMYYPINGMIQRTKYLLLTGKD